LLFEFPFQEWDIVAIAELVDGRRGVLVPGEYGVEFMDNTLRQLAAFDNTIDHQLNCRFLIF